MRVASAQEHPLALVAPAAQPPTGNLSLGAEHPHLLRTASALSSYVVGDGVGDAADPLNRYERDRSWLMSDPPKTADVVTLVTLGALLLAFALALAGCLFDRYRSSRDPDVPAGPPPARPPRLTHLSGLRWVVACWILDLHVYELLEQAPDGAAAVATSPTPLRRLIKWAPSGVFFFIVLSGFVMQWSTSTALVHTSARELRWWYINRLSRVLFLTWLSMALEQIMGALGWGMVGPMCADPTKFDAAEVARCYTMVQYWLFPSGDACPSNTVWTINALLPSWLLFPVTQWVASGVERRGGIMGLVAVSLALYSLNVSRFLSAVLTEGYATDFFFFHNYYWPPATMGDFAVGVFAASIAKQLLPAQCADGEHGSAAAASTPTYGLRAFLADALVVGFLASELFIPINVDSPYGRLPDTARFGAAGSMWTVLFAAYLICSCVGNGVGIVASATSHVAIASLGEYAFALYLLQFPVRRLVQQFVFDVNSSFGAIAFFGILTVISILYTDKVERPVVAFVLDAIRKIDPPPPTSSPAGKKLGV